MSQTTEEHDAIERNLDMCYAHSPYRYPRDFKPTIWGANILSDETYRRQICAGAAWLDSHPGVDVYGPEMKSFLDSTYGDHSANSGNAVMDHLATIQEHGFDAYITARRELQKNLHQSR